MPRTPSPSYGDMQHPPSPSYGDVQHPPSPSYADMQHPPSPSYADMAGVTRQTVPPAAPAPFTAAEPKRKLPLSNVALTFIAFYLVAAAVLLIVLVARHGNSRLPTVTAVDQQKTPISIASVFVDGHEVCGALPCQLPDSSGSHWVSIRAAGYAAPDPVEINGKTPIHFTLRRVAGAAPAPSTASPTPSAATPPPAKPAAATTTTANQSQSPEKQAATSAPAPVSHPHRSVVHRPARLSFYATPSSLVLLDGHPLGKTPKFGVPVSPGRHSVLFIHGSHRIARSAWASRGRTGSVSAHF